MLLLLGGWGRVPSKVYNHLHCEWIYLWFLLVRAICCVCYVPPPITTGQDIYKFPHPVTTGQDIYKFPHPITTGPRIYTFTQLLGQKGMTVQIVIANKKIKSTKRRILF